MRIFWCQEHEHPGLAENVCFYPLWYQHKIEGRMSAFREAAANCRMVPMRLIPDNTPFTVPAAEGRNEEPYELGWCAEHQDVARRWPDGSWSCWWESVVEASGDHSPTDFRPLWEALDGETP